MSFPQTLRYRPRKGRPFYQITASTTGAAKGRRSAPPPTSPSLTILPASGRRSSRRFPLRTWSPAHNPAFARRGQLEEGRRPNNGQEDTARALTIAAVSGEVRSTEQRQPPILYLGTGVAVPQRMPHHPMLEECNAGIKTFMALNATAAGVSPVQRGVKGHVYGIKFSQQATGRRQGCGPRTTACHTSWPNRLRNSQRVVPDRCHAVDRRCEASLSASKPSLHLPRGFDGHDFGYVCPHALPSTKRPSWGLHVASLANRRS